MNIEKYKKKKKKKKKKKRKGKTKHGERKRGAKIASTFGWEKFDSNLNINVELNSTGFKFNCLDEF